jgi:hypothetical protein
MCNTWNTTDNGALFWLTSAYCLRFCGMLWVSQSMFYLIARITILGLRFLLLFLCNNITSCRANLNHPWHWSKISQRTGPSAQATCRWRSRKCSALWLPEAMSAPETHGRWNDDIFSAERLAVWDFYINESFRWPTFHQLTNDICILHIKFLSVQNIDNWW